MKAFFYHWSHTIRALFSDWHYIFLLLTSGVLFWGANASSWYFSRQNDLWNTSSPVGDTLFSVLPRVDLSFIFVGGAIALVAVGAIYLVFFDPKKIPLTLLAFAFLVFFRGLIINATHIGIPLDHIPPQTWGLEMFSFQNDLFFSGHTAGPFLAALLIWDKKYWRYFFLLMSVVMAFTVLSMRLHYTIDIIGAYFITYGLYHLAEYIYHGDRKWNIVIKKWLG